MENEEKTVDFQDETQEEETFEVDETEESDDSDEESSDNDENSTQNQEDELKKAQAEIAKLNRLLKKTEKKEEESPKSDNSSNAVTKEDLERLRLEAKGYEEEDIDLIMKFGGVKALEDESIKDVINIRKEKRQQVNAQATSKTQGKSSRKYSQEQLRAMPLDKLEKLIREGKIK